MWLSGTLRINCCSVIRFIEALRSRVPNVILYSDRQIRELLRRKVGKCFIVR